MKVDGVHYCNECNAQLGDNRVGGTCKSCHIKKQNEKRHYCRNCNKEMGHEWLLGDTCGNCCRLLHAKVVGK